MKKIIITAALFFAAVGGASAMQLDTSCPSCTAPGSNSSSGATVTANPVANSSSGSVSAGGSSTSVAGTNTGANSQSLTFNSAATPADTTATVNTHMSGSYTIKNTPSVSGPPLVSSNDTLTL